MKFDIQSWGDDPEDDDIINAPIIAASEVNRMR